MPHVTIWCVGTFVIVGTYIISHSYFLKLSERHHSPTSLYSHQNTKATKIKKKMAFLLNKTTLASHFRSHAQKAEDSIYLSRRGFHIEPGTREKALLAEDSALKPFKSYKKSVKSLKRIGDVLTIVVVAGCCYEIYVRAVTREEARKQ